MRIAQLAMLPCLMSIAAACSALPGSASDSAFCEAARDAEDIADQSSGLAREADELVTSGDLTRSSYDELIGEYERLLPRTSDVYFSMAEAAPEPERSDIELVREHLTGTMAVLIAGADGQMDPSAVEARLEELETTDFVEASARVETFTREECDIER